MWMVMMTRLNDDREDEVIMVGRVSCLGHQ